ncbi:MAG: NUDIX hydrolase [Acidimicrobiales bacterium]|nr:NUDIX hydrolase [Acidimicrobiales bacterium]MDG1877645.1 NUDIX hydrolase [Acidimicrobiales bacterium]
MVIPGEWSVHGERSIYDSEWMSLRMVDVETPSGTRFEHHVVRMPNHAAGTLVVVEGRVLLIWRHRFVTDSWGWEIPAGRIDVGESVAEAAVRECIEETGWQPGVTTPLIDWHPCNGSIDLTFHVVRATDAKHVGEPTDLDEAAAVDWVPLDDIRLMLRNGEIGDGLSVVALLAELAGV